jgi:hypothetical protein
MPAVNLFFLTPGTGSPKEPVSATVSAKTQPAEKFQTVMERLMGFVVGTGTAAPKYSSQTLPPVLPLQNNGDTENPASNAASDGIAQAMQSNPDCAISMGAKLLCRNHGNAGREGKVENHAHPLIPAFSPSGGEGGRRPVEGEDDLFQSFLQGSAKPVPASIPAVVAEPVATALPAVSLRNTRNVAVNPPANPQTKSSSPPANLMPVANKLNSPSYVAPVFVEAVAAGFTGKSTRNTDNASASPPANPQTKTSSSNDKLLPVTDSSLSPVIIAPIQAEAVAAALPAISAGMTNNVATNPKINSDAKSSGFVPASFVQGKSTLSAGLTWIDNQQSKFSGRSNTSSTATNILKNPSIPVENPASGQAKAGLPAMLSPVADEEPDIKQVTSGNQFFRSETATNTVLPQPENTRNEIPAPQKAAQAPENQVQPAAITTSLPPGPDKLYATNPAPSIDGTAVAKQDTTMKMATKMTDFSEAEQKLPHTATIAAGENLPTRSSRGSATATIKIRIEPAPTVGVAISTIPSASKAVSAQSADLTQVTPASASLVQRAQDLVSLQVTRLQESGADEMNVVIKPDAGLQLSLNLQQRGGTVEVQAVLDHGNYDLLSRHWPELQQQLESRGVRVAPLADADQSFGGGSEGFRQPTTSHGQQAGEDAGQEEIPAVLIPGLPTATATASASQISSQQLETWA